MVDGELDVGVGGGEGGKGDHDYVMEQATAKEVLTHWKLGFYLDKAICILFGKCLRWGHGCRAMVF